MSSSKEASENRKRTFADDPKSDDNGPTISTEELNTAKKIKSDTALKELKNKIDTDFDEIDFSCTRKNGIGETSNFKIASWNVNGIRALVKKTQFQYVYKEDADIVCLQEVRCVENELPPEVVNIPGYHRYWFPAAKKGYSGVGLLSKTKPINVQNGFGVEELDSEGRLITAEYDKFYVVTAYVPNSGIGLKNLSKRVQWNIELRKYLKSLDEKKPVILAGDLNVAHQEIDLARPSRNVNTAGFLKEERDDMTALLDDGFVDSFRAIYPDRPGYSFWMNIANHRTENIGWRVDYFVISKRFMDRVCDSVIRPDIYGSDHCPVVLYLSV